MLGLEALTMGLLGLLILACPCTSPATVDAEGVPSYHDVRSAEECLEQPCGADGKRRCRVPFLPWLLSDHAVCRERKPDASYRCPLHHAEDFPGANVIVYALVAEQWLHGLRDNRERLYLEFLHHKIGGIQNIYNLSIRLAMYRGLFENFALSPSTFDARSAPIKVADDMATILDGAHRAAQHVAFNYTHVHLVGPQGCPPPQQHRAAATLNHVRAFFLLSRPTGSRPPASPTMMETRTTCTSRPMVSHQVTWRAIPPTPIRQRHPPPSDLAGPFCAILQNQPHLWLEDRRRSLGDIGGETSAFRDAHNKYSCTPAALCVESGIYMPVPKAPLAASHASRR